MDALTAMGQRCLRALGVLLLCWSGALLAQPLRAELAGATQALDRARIAELAGGTRSLTVLEPHEDRERSYVGASMQSLLQALYGDAWRRAGAVQFECADGYRALVDPARLVAHPALLAWESGDGAPFTLRNRTQNDELVTLGPYYLVWDNLAAPEVRARGASDWPYQVVGIALVEVDTLLPKVLPPEGADAAVQRGFAAFRSHCLTCHSINGQGGAKAPELNYPASVTEYLAPGWLRRWILEPTAIRHATTMPGLPPELPGREAVAADIERYLQAMAAHKQRP